MIANASVASLRFIHIASERSIHIASNPQLDEQTWLVNTINAIVQSPFWSSTAVIIAYDDSDGWYDHVMPPIVNQSATPDDNLTGSGACGDGAAVTYQGRCGYGPRLPLVVVSPYARVNFVDHTLTDQPSILRFIEDNWTLGRIGDASSDAYAGSLLNMFDFRGNGPAKAVYLDPATGLVTNPPVAPGGGPTGAATTAVANPKGATTVSKQFTLDGTSSTSFDGKPLAYQWALAPGSPIAAINSANTSTPAVQFDSGFGAYAFVLTVTDSAGKTATDSTIVTYLGR